MEVKDGFTLSNASHLLRGFWKDAWLTRMIRMGRNEMDGDMDDLPALWKYGEDWVRRRI